MRRLLQFVLLAIFFAANPLRAQSPPVVVRASTILDGKGHALSNTLIVVEETKIVRIGGAVPAGAIIYDLAGLTVTPGWIDTHSHLFWHFNNGRLAGKDEPPAQAILHAAENAVLTLDAGFTTIQSPGSPEDKGLRDASGCGIIPGPRMLT